MKVDISIIVPMYNEERNVLLLYDRLKKVLSSLRKSYEIIFVDDGSRDKTFQNIKLVCSKDSSVRCIRFRKNFKKSAAYMAGFKEAKGEIIITMDADLQDDPNEIPNFLKSLSVYDLVVGWKFKRRDSLHKTIPSKIFNHLNYKMFGVKLHDNDCGFRAMKSEVAKKLDLYGDLYRYIPALVSKLGFRIGEIKVSHHKRRFGKSKYGVGRLLTGAFDLLTVKFISDFNQRPLHLFGGLGALFSFLGFLAEFYVVFMRLVFQDLFMKHLPMILLGILLTVLGVQFIGIGLLGELISSFRRVDEIYQVKEILN